MRKLTIILLFLLFSNLSYSQQEVSSARNSMAVVFYNVENLFDISNDPYFRDEQYLPESPKKWNVEKYQKKISDIADVLSSVYDKELPVLIGLAEIENRKVLEDLIGLPALKKGKYGIVHFDIKDEISTESGLLYNTESIELLDSKSIPVDFGNDLPGITSYMLYAKCRIKGDNIYHIFINQWPSRTPDAQDSEIQRVKAAIALRREVDKIFNTENNAHIIIMGDFNDEPTNKSLFQMLNATNKRKNVHYRDLYNLMFDAHNTGNEGSVFIKGNWLMFDQLIVSPALFVKGPEYYVSFGDGRVLKNEKVLVKNPDSGEMIPNSTYTGDKYNGGVSDHLPVFVVLKKDRK